MKISREEEDKLLRELLEFTPGYIDYNDPTPLCCDKNFIWYSAAQLRDKELKYNANQPKTE